jgi:peptidoglycan hydrolase-like protein with peptidoglycan-binding domain
MHGSCARWAGPVAVAFSLCILPSGAGAVGRVVQLAQTAVDPGHGASDQSSSPAAVAQAPSPANTPEQIRKAQLELRRLDCLKGRIDGKLGDQTREAVKKFWASAGQQPVAEITVTDELIANLAERGDNYCRPKRRFFGFGGRPSLGFGAHPGGNSPLPFFAPGARPGPSPATGAQPPSPTEAH